MAGHIVVSHSREDQDYVDRLVTYLRSRGLTVWADRTLEPGTPDWASVIGTVIHSCAALVAVMTESAVASPWVDREVTIAINLRRPVLALSRAGVRLTRLAAIPAESIDADALPSEAFVARLRGLQARGGTEPAPSTPPPVPPTRPDAPPVSATPARARRWPWFAGGAVIVAAIVVAIVLLVRASG